MKYGGVHKLCNEVRGRITLGGTGLGLGGLQREEGGLQIPKIVLRNI